MQQCDTAYALREEKGTNGWRRALARQSEAKAVTFWRANGDQVDYFLFRLPKPSSEQSSILKTASSEQSGTKYKTPKPAKKNVPDFG